MFFFYSGATINAHSIGMCLLIGFNMKQLSRIFRIYSNAPIAVFMAIGALLELLCALGLYAYSMPVLAACALVFSGFLGLISFTLAASVYRDVMRNTWILE
jgi:hypothetical protein